MDLPRPARFALLLPLLCAIAVARADGFDAVERHAALAAAVEQLPADVDRARWVAGAYARAFGDAPPPSAGETRAVLEARFNAADLATFYSVSGDYLPAMRDALRQLERNGWATEHHHRMLHADLILAGRFDDARRFRAAHPAIDLPAIPGISATPDLRRDAPSFLDRQQDGSLRQLNIAFDAPAQVVVVAHPLCAFTARAIEAIESDPELGAAFARHATWVVPPQRRFYLDAVDASEASHAGQRMVRVVDAHDSAMLRTPATPTFYVLRDGAVVDEVVGWPDEGRLEAIRAALARVDLLR